MMSVSTCSAQMASSYYQKDNYYTRDISAKDRWQGRLCKDLGLKSGKTINAEAFQLLLDNSGRKCAAYDVTFSAPKSVSIAAEISETVRQDVMKAHHEAVAEVLKEIEENEVGCRITKDGQTEWIQTGKMACAKFDHNVSREGDMQVHTHCVILNKTEYQGKDYSIDGRRFFECQKVYGTEYRVRLGAKLQKMGYQIYITDAEKGFFELSDISQDSIDYFSKRREQIVSELDKTGQTGAEAAQKAALKTRQSKKHLDMDAKRKEWQQELQALRQKTPVKGESIKLTAMMRQEAFTTAVKTLEGKQFAWTGKDMEQASLAQGVACGMTVKHADKLLAKSGLIKLNPKTSSGLESEPYYTTRHNIAQEHAITANVETGKGIMPALTIEQATAALGKACEANGWTLGDEQKGVVHHIANSPDQFIAVRGLAGTGKTFTLNAAREALEANGFEVKGMSASGQAAEELGADAKIKDCSTIHHTLNAAEKEAGNALPGQNYETKTTWDFTGLQKSTKPTVWFVDEASLTDNNLFLNIQKMAKLKGNKVVFIGDDRQMPPVGAGNAFANLAQSGKISTVELSNIRRQTDPELLRAVTEAVKGETKVSLDIISKKIQEIPSHSKRMNAITKDYTSLSSVERKQTLVLTATNADRVELNSKIRKQLIKNGELDEGQKFHVETGKNRIEERSFAVKDRVTFLRNDNRLGVKNGTIAVITGIMDDKITVAAGEKKIVVDTNQYKNIDHAYCQTPYKAQGKTVQRAIINMDSKDTKLNSKNAFYVVVSRAKTNVKLFCDSREKLDPQISKFVHKMTSQDFNRNLGKSKGLKGRKASSMDFSKAWKTGAEKGILKGTKSLKGSKHFRMPKITKAGTKTLISGNLAAAADLAKFSVGQSLGVVSKTLDALHKSWKIIKTPFSDNPNWSKVDMANNTNVARMTAVKNIPKKIDAFTSEIEKDAITHGIDHLSQGPSMHW